MQKRDNKEIGKRVEEVMNDQRPKSKRAFAIAIDADPSFFDKILKGSASLTDSIAGALEQKFGVNKDWLYTGDGPKHGPARPNIDGEDFRAKYIKQLERENQYLQDIVKTNLTLVLATVRTLSVRQQAVGEVVLDSLERLELSLPAKKKSAGALAAAADRNIVQIEREAHAHDNAVAIGR